MAEISVEGTVVGIAEAQGWFVRKIVWPGHKGAPDRVFIKDGRVVWIEFKDRGKPAHPLQARKHREMAAAGASVYLCDNVKDAAKILGLVLPRTGGWSL